jgi:quercetin dioxygenase-like cupin family protein
MDGGKIMQEAAMTVKHSNDVEAKNVAAGKDTTIQVLISSQEGPNFALRKFSMKPGGGMPRHTNEVEHEQYVLRGQATITIGDETHHGQDGRCGLHPCGRDPFV